ncbi:MAG TPA: carboxypeptidase-like regulatory domain-containing protein [Anaerolineales bacterium]
MNRFLFFILSVALLSACDSTLTPVADTGVEGQAQLGPMCPVVRLDQPCPDRPYQATLTVLNPAGKKIAQVQTDVNGLYRLALPLGDYIMHPESPNVMPHAQDQSFTVIAGQFTKLDIVYDSGIR